MAAPVERVYEFEVEAPIGAVAALLSEPRRLDSVTPPWFALEVGENAPERIGPGSEIDYRLRWHGVARRWRSRIVEWDLPHVFTYEQAIGPFKSFRHRHVLSRERNGTRVADLVRYETPGGRLVDRLLVAPDLERIFTFRAAAVRRELEGAGTSVRALGGASRESHPLRHGFELGHREADAQVTRRA